MHIWNREPRALNIESVTYLSALTRFALRGNVTELSRSRQVASPHLAAGREICVYAVPRLQGRHDTLHLQRSEGRAISECDGRCGQ